MKSLRSIELCVVLFVVGAPSPLSAQAVHVVDKTGGAGSGYVSIGAAVTAAVDGDFVLVRSGLYLETLELDGKGLTIQAESLADVEVNRIVVRNLGPSQYATIRGIDVGSAADTIEIADNQGIVWIEDVEVDVGAFSSTSTLITNSDDVVLRNVMLDAGQGSFGDFYCAAIVTSNAVLYECDFRGPDLAGQSGGVGLTASSATVTIYGSTIRGGAGSDVFGNPIGGGIGLSVHGTSVIDIIDSTVEAGPLSSSHIIISGGLAVVNQLPANVDAHELSIASPLRAGDSATMTFVGHAGDLTYAMSSAAPGPLTTFKRGFGPLALAAPVTFHPFGVLPASGTLSVVVSAPPILADVVSIYLQGLFLAPEPHRIAFGTPTQIHVLAPSF